MHLLVHVLVLYILLLTIFILILYFTQQLSHAISDNFVLFFFFYFVSCSTYKIMIIILCLFLVLFYLLIEFLAVRYCYLRKIVVCKLITEICCRFLSTLLKNKSFSHKQQNVRETPHVSYFK